MAKFMRTRGLLMIGAAMAILFLPFSTIADTLVWDASSGQVDGYRVHWGTSKSSQPNNRDVGGTTRFDLDKLPLSEGVTYYLSVSAYNKAGESPPCDPIAFIPGDNTPPAPPRGLWAD